MSNLHILQLQRWLAMTVVGVERRPGSQVHRCSHVVRRHERTQAEMPDGQPPVVGARCPPGAVAGQRWKGHLDLLGQPGDQGSGRFGVVVPALARMAQQCDVERQPEAVLRAAGAYRSNQDHHRPEDSCAPAKRCRRESRVALRAPMPVQDVVKPLARPQNDGSGFETG